MNDKSSMTKRLLISLQLMIQDVIDQTLCLSFNRLLLFWPAKELTAINLIYEFQCIATAVNLSNQLFQQRQMIHSYSDKFTIIMFSQPSINVS